jgi:glycosyltransferase involved in cell wall biosynthesis
VRFLEDMSMRHAKRCLIICEALRPMLLARGVPADKIAVAPNCVDVAAFSPGPPSPALQDALGLGGKRVLGFIGSFFRYEGLELLVRAFTELAAQRQDIVLLLVGDGETEGELRELVAQSPVRDRVIFAGRAPYAQVMEYYKLFELMILPRLETPETRLVTPLKPLEIMSMEKPLLASDIGGHRELIEDGATGLLFPPGGVSHLVAACSTLLDDPRLARKLASQGRAWAAANRDWDVLMQRYLAIYADLGVRA